MCRPAPFWKESHMIIGVELTGISPILFNPRALPGSDAAAKAKEISGLGEPETPYMVAERKLHRNSDGEPIVPAEMILTCLAGAGRFFKNGRKQVTTDKMSQLPGAVTILTPLVKIQYEQPWFPDSRWAVNGKTGDQILNVRPCFPDWKLGFDMYLDETLLPAQLVHDITERAGKTIGLGSFRPSRGGSFGKFMISKWEVKQKEGGMDVVLQMQMDAIAGMRQHQEAIAAEQKKDKKSKK